MSKLCIEEIMRLETDVQKKANLDVFGSSALMQHAELMARPTACLLLVLKMLV